MSQAIWDENGEVRSKGGTVWAEESKTVLREHCFANKQEESYEKDF